MKKMEEEKKRKQEELKRFVLNLFINCVNQTDDFSFFNFFIFLTPSSVIGRGMRG